MSIIGERFNDGSGTLSQYRPHPPAASCYFANGDAVDAGTVQEMDQNISHLAAESYRHLVWQPLMGLTPQHASYAAGYAGFNDVTAPPTGITTDLVFQIPWDSGLYGSSMRFGPFFAVCDNPVVGGWSPRRVLCEIEMNSIGTGNLIVYMAMTLRPDPPTASYVDGTLFRYTGAISGGGERWAEIMSPTQPRMPYTGPSQQCRPASASVPSSSRMSAGIQFYIWCGMFSSNAADSIGSFSACEVP